MTRFTRAHRIVALVFLGTLLLQCAWIVAVAPYGSMDEPDHVYRAESVAAGHWRSVPRPAAYTGRGDLVRVAAGTARAVFPTCHSFTFIADADCRPARTYKDGTVTVASGAARYFPGYYAVVGQPSRWLPAIPALYAMRLLDALVCSCLVALAAWGTTLWSRTSWPLLGVIAGCTPETMYQGGTPAPNGPEIFAGLALWTLLLALVRLPAPDRRVRALLLAAVPLVVLLGTLRTLGPLWLCLVVVTTAAFAGRDRLRQVAIAHRCEAALLVVALVVSTVVGLGWSLANRTNSLAQLPDSHHHAHAVLTSFLLIPVWFAGVIGMFPEKSHFAPYVVYLVGIGFLGGVLVAAWRASGCRERLLLAMIVLISVAIPLAFTLRTYESFGPMWQGKYSWPYTCGSLVAASLVLDRRGRGPGVRGLVGLALGGLVLLHLPGALGMVSGELWARSGVRAGTLVAHLPGPVTALLVAGVFAWLMALLASAVGATPPPSAVSRGPALAMPASQVEVIP